MPAPLERSQGRIRGLERLPGRTRGDARARARDLYAQDGLTVAQVASRLKVGERTVMRWKADDAAQGKDWGKLRAATMLGRESIEAMTAETLAVFVPLHQRLVREIAADDGIPLLERQAALAGLTDTYLKQMKACAVSAPQISELAVATDVIFRLSNFVAEKCPDAAPELLAALEAFGPELVKAYAK